MEYITEHMRKCILKYHNPGNPNYTFVLRPFVSRSFVLRLFAMRSFVLRVFVAARFCPALFY